MSSLLPDAVAEYVSHARKGFHESGFCNPVNGRPISRDGEGNYVEIADFDFSGVESRLDEAPVREAQVEQLADALKGLSVWVADTESKYWGQRALVVFWMLNRSQFGCDTLAELERKTGSTRQAYSLWLRSIAKIVGTHFRLASGLHVGSKANRDAATAAHVRAGHHIRNASRPAISKRLRNSLEKIGKLPK